jgi:hypothetical protein
MSRSLTASIPAQVGMELHLCSFRDDPVHLPRILEQKTGVLRLGTVSRAVILLSIHSRLTAALETSVAVVFFVHSLSVDRQVCPACPHTAHKTIRCHNTEAHNTTQTHASVKDTCFVRGIQGNMSIAHNEHFSFYCIRALVEVCGIAPLGDADNSLQLRWNEVCCLSCIVAFRNVN